MIVILHKRLHQIKVLQKSNAFWDAELAELKKYVVKRFSKDKKSEGKLNKFVETQAKMV